MSTVLVVDDKDMLRDSVAVTLQRAGFTIIGAGSGSQALELVASRRPEAIVTDLKMPGMTGVELMEKVRELDDDLPIVLMTAYGTVQTAVQAMKLGAFDYISKPFEGDELVIAVKRAIEHARVKRENAALRASAGFDGSTPAASGSAPGAEAQARALGRLIGDSAQIQAVRDKLRDYAGSHGTVLISGESGTGKEVVARAIHELSPRAGAPFLAVNCAAMSESLLESELFGHEKGAFTGADKLRKGRFELAHTGTLLLDEISEVRPQVQAKLLRVLQERSFERVGSSSSIGVDVRVIATTNRHLTDEVKRGGFRSDLYFRLNVLPVHLPPLRERGQDVRQLAPHFVSQVCRREGRPAVQITPGAMDLLVAYPWPGNVRELQNLCERAVVLSGSAGGSITPELIGNWLAAPPSVTGHPALDGTDAGVQSDHQAERTGATATAHRQPEAWAAEVKPSFALGRPLEEIERQIIVDTLGKYNGHRVKTARELGIGVRTLGLKLKKWKQEHLVAETL